MPGRFTRQQNILCSICWLLLSVAGSTRAAPAGSCVEVSPDLPVLTDWRLRVGDDPSWQDPALDDASWQTVVPALSWEQQGFEGVDGFAWYRVHFRLDGPLPCRPLGLNLGNVDDADETFLNGVLIGRTGRLPPAFQGLPSAVRTYPLPASLLRQGDNVLAIRVYDLAGPGGLTSRPPRIDDLQTMSSHLSIPDVIRLVAPMLCAVVGIYFLLLFLLSPQRTSSLYFFGFAVGMSWVTLARSQLPTLMGLDPGLLYILDWLGVYLSPSLLLLFVLNHCEQPIRRWIFVLVGITLFEASLLLLPSQRLFRHDFFFYVGQPIILIMIVKTFYTFFARWRAGNREAGWLTWGFILLGATATAEIGASLVGFSIPSLIPGGVAAFVLFVMGVLAFREILQGQELAMQAEALAMLNAGLEYQVEERTRHLEEARQALQDRNERLAAFNALVSHDLKAPIRGLEFLAEYLETDLSTSLNEEGHRLLNLMRSVTAQMRALVDGLMGLAQLERRPTLSMVSLERVLRNVQELLAGELMARGATIEVAPGLPQVYANEALLTEVFSNLVANGVKYNVNPSPRVQVGLVEELPAEALTKAGETPTKAGETPTKAGEALGEQSVCIEIRDNGIGVAEEYQATIFEPFKRLHSSDEYEGTGIGLAIVRQAMHNLNGRLLLRSRAGEGSSFFVLIPRHAPAPSDR